MALIQPRCPRDKRIGITYKKYANHILKELFRKTIHLCSAFLPYFFGLAKFPFLIALAAVLVIYIISEFLRLNGINIPIISSVTKVAARKRDENKFVIGPVTLCIGIILAELLWEPLPAAIGIYALAFGDGLASLAGKLFGCIQIPLTQGKTAAGSLVYSYFYFYFCSMPSDTYCVNYCHCWNVCRSSAIKRFRQYSDSCWSGWTCNYSSIAENYLHK